MGLTSGNLGRLDVRRQSIRHPEFTPVFEIPVFGFTPLFVCEQSLTQLSRGVKIVEVTSFGVFDVKIDDRVVFCFAIGANK